MKGARYLCSGFGQAVESGLTACRVGKELGMFTLLNPSPLRENLVLPAMPYVDVLCVNESESKQLLDRPPTEETPFLPAGRGAQEALPVRKHRHDARRARQLRRYGGRFLEIPGTPVKMVDETGAGDGFLAAMAYCLSRGRTLKQSMEWANVYSAYLVTKSGSLEYYPWKVQIPEIFTNLHREDILFE
jgi:ribokinase